MKPQHRRQVKWSHNEHIYISSHDGWDTSLVRYVDNGKVFRQSGLCEVHSARDTIVRLQSCLPKLHGPCECQATKVVAALTASIPNLPNFFNVLNYGARVPHEG